jgi:hypothetical protein
MVSNPLLRRFSPKAKNAFGKKASSLLTRSFVEKATEKSFDKGLFWGVFAGTMVTHFYKEDQYKKLQVKYYSLKHQFIHSQLTQTHGRAAIRLDEVNE